MPRPASGVGISLADLERLLSARRRELERLQEQRARIQRELNGVERQISRIGGATIRNGARRPRNAKNLIEAIADALSGGQLPVGDIVDRVQSSGYQSSSANFRGIVNQTLIKERGRFTNVARGVYRLSGEKAEGHRTRGSMRRRGRRKKASTEIQGPTTA